MNIAFYNKIKSQPDLQDVAVYLKEHLNNLKNLDSSLNQLLLKKTALNELQLSELSSKVQKLIHQYFPVLVDNYCNLDMDYRNKTIIKRETVNHNIKEYTAKDILLQNTAKLIEEINLLENQFLNLKQSNEIISLNLTQDKCESDVVLDYEKPLIKVQEKVFLKKDKKPTIMDNFYQILQDIIFLPLMILAFSEIGFLLIYLLLSGILTFFTYNKVSEYNKANIIVDNIKQSSNIISHYYFKHKDYIGVNEKIYKNYPDNIVNSSISYSNNNYYNVFGGKTTIFPVSYHKNNDLFAIKNENISTNACSKIAINLQKYHVKFLDINHTTIIKDGLIDVDQLMNSCTLEKNTLIVIPNIKPKN